MGLTREYLRYVPSSNFNIIASTNCNVKFVTLEGQEGRYVAVGACEHIIVWDLRLKSSEVVSIFSGHRSEVKTLAYDNFGHKLASGANDTDVIVWDTVAEAGVCRFTGHKGPVTQVVFMSGQTVLVSSSKDGLVKLWDLDTQYCFRTLVGHRSEVWGMCLTKDDKYLVTGCGDAELRVWKFVTNDHPKFELTDINDEDDPRYPLRCVKVGSLLREGRGRVVSLNMDSRRHILACHGTDNQLELFRFCEDEEASVRYKKRIKKEQKKATKEGKKIEADETSSSTPDLRDEVRRLQSVKLSDKPKSLDVVFGGGSEIRVVTNLACNVVELYSIKNAVDKEVTPHLLRSIRSQGHRSEIRAVAFSSDNLAIVSGAADGIKLWNRPSQACLRTAATGCYVVSICFVPGDRHVLAGLKDGRLLIVDIATGDVLEEIPAHAEGTELWSLCLLPDLRGCVSGGGDKTCKWWQFELIRDETSTSKARVLSLLHTRTLALDEGVLCVKVTPDSRFVAVALLDSTVKIFYEDSFKLHMSLYGHKLPVLCMDISFDSKLIATGSADRNMKIWGLDFGDCHKSLFAHDDSVTGLEFVPQTHLLFSCGKDGSIKQWDADSFVRITTLPEHKGEAWCLSISPNGNFVVSGGADRVLRLCERTDQPLVLEDEREEEREREEAEQLATGDDLGRTAPGSGILPTRKTVGSERAADSLLECLSTCSAYQEQLSEHVALQAASDRPLPALALPPLMLAYRVTTLEDLLLENLKRIRTSELEEALLLLPFMSACELLQKLPGLLTRGDSTELVCKVLVFLLKVHHAPLVANHSLLPLLKDLQKQTSTKVTELRDMVGYNLHAMQHLQQEIEEAEGVQLFRDASREKRTRDKKRKQREKAKRSITVLTT